jgi:hypothetical protein
MLRGNLDESLFIDPLGRDVDPDRDRTAPEGASVYLRGWAYFADPERAAAGIVAQIDDGPRFELAYNQDRPDVVRSLGLASVRTIGFHGVWSLAGLTLGPHVLHVYALDPVFGGAHAIGEPLAFDVIAGSYAFPAATLLEGTMALTFDYLLDAETIENDEDDERDAPQPNAPLAIARGRTALATGWAIDLVHRTPVRDVYACIDGRTFVRGIVGRKREDAATSVGIEEAWRCGYVVQIPTAGIATGDHRVSIRAVSADGAGYEVTGDIPLTVLS